MSLDIYNDMEHLNGDYELAIHVADFKAGSNLVWDLGTLQLWFK